MTLAQQKSDWLICGVLALIAVAVGAYAHGPSLLNDYVLINDDVMQHTFWMDRYHDPDLFPGDIYAEYVNFYLPLGFKAVYYFGTIFFDQITFGKILAIALYAVSGIYLFRLGKAMGGVKTGIVLAMLFLCLPMHMDRFLGGQFRAFAFPLLSSFLFYLFCLRWQAASAVMVLMALFYPPALLIAYGTMGLFMVIHKNNKEWPGPGRYLTAVFLPLGVFIGFLAYKSLTKPAFLGSLTGIDMIIANIDHIVYGRSPNLPVKPILSMIREYLGGHILFLAGLAVSGLAIPIAFKEKNHNLIRAYALVLCLCLASMALYQLSTLLLVKLYLPVKYVRYSFPIAELSIIALGAGFLLDKIRLKIARAVIVVMMIYVCMFSYGLGVKPIVPDVDQRQNSGLFRYISQLPKDAVIAADPDMSDYVSTFSRRSTFIKYELAYPWFENYARLVDQRIADFYKAYFSDDLSDMYAFCKANDIDYVVYDLDDFQSGYFEDKEYYIKDTHELIINALESGRGFAADGIDPRAVLYKSDNGRIIVVKADKTTFGIPEGL